MPGAGLRTVGVALSILIALGVAGCAKRLMIPDERTQTSFFLPYRSERVSDVCATVLAEYVAGRRVIESLADGDLVTREMRGRTFTVGRCGDCRLVTCTLTKGAWVIRRTHTGGVEHWNVLIEETEKGTGMWISLT